MLERPFQLGPTVQETVGPNNLEFGRTFCGLEPSDGTVPAGATLTLGTPDGIR
jgi:hypothetical protein